MNMISNTPHIYKFFTCILINPLQGIHVRVENLCNLLNL